MNLPNGLVDILRPETLAWLQETVLPGYVKQRRWFAAKDKKIKSVRLMDGQVVNFGDGELLFAEIEVALDDGAERFQLPLGLHRHGDPASQFVEPLKLADVRWADEDAVLTDAFALDLFPRGLLDAVRNDAVIAFDGGKLAFLSLPGLQSIDIETGAVIRRLAVEQSNSSVVIADRIIMKLMRRVMQGINPEVEMVRYLTEQGYRNTPPLLGEVQRRDRNGAAVSVVVVQEFVANQGDAWGFTLDFIRDHPERLSDYRGFARVFGKRLAELHAILARPTAIEAFAPRAAQAADARDWAERAKQQLTAAFDALQRPADLAERAARDRSFVLRHRAALLQAIPSLAAAGVGALMTRIHGDFHLGQILIADDDAYIIDFEGEPAKPLEVRRAKTSPLRDAAGLLRSLHYAMAASQMPQSDFVGDMSASFLQAYRAVERASPYRWVGSDAQEQPVLDLFLLEKCAYEVCYEVANRPGWLPIPLRGFVEIVARVLSLSLDTIDG